MTISLLGRITSKAIGKEARAFVKSAQHLAIRKCNEDLSEEQVARLEGVLEAKFCNLYATWEIPNYIQLYGDPRGFVAYVDGAKINEEQKEFMRDHGMPQDWGGNFGLAARMD